MKILVISQYPLYASTTNRMMGFAIALRKRGHKVTLFIVGNKYLPGTQKTYLPNEIEGVQVKYTPSLPNAFIVMPGFISGICAIFFLLLVKLPLTFIRSLMHDVVYSSKPLPYGTIVALPASFLARKPFILDTDDWEGVGGFATIKQGSRALVKGIITYFEEMVPHHADAIVAASHLLAERIFLSGIKREAVFIAQNGADIKTFNPILDGKPIRSKFSLQGFVFCYLGTFKKGGANWQMLLDSFHFAWITRNDIMLLVIGFGNELQDAINYSNKLGMSNNVCFAGKVEHKDVPNYLSAANAYLLPYQSDFPHTFINIGRSSLKLYEYMAMGRPIVATDVGELSVSLKDGAGILVNTNDAEMFGQGIIRLLSMNASEIEAMGNTARQRAEQIYNYNSMSAVVEKALYYARNV